MGTLRGLLLFAICPLAFTGLILWIRSIVQRYYKNKLQDRANEYTKQEIEDKDKRIERLEAEVSTLAKQLHRDNHLMASLDRSVQAIAECDSEEQRSQIITEVHTLCRERSELLAKEQQQNKILPSTGIALIDSSLSELYVKAAARGISFDLTVTEELYYLVNNIISQTDLQTLLCDHIKDAIIAVESAGVNDGRILVSIEKNDGIFEIAVRDNGVDYAAGTLSKLGREQVTTHADDGGSGIGFMTTFETLRKTKGSLIITEYEQKTPFSKSVAFVFDGLNRFIISTYRRDELEKIIDRDDVSIM
ncbi:MAG: HAMP domain-containing histidine kinase [Ruminococcus sp.]|nr:HAMP domain-containing histidine kinase [Ruminococcus sp.]